MNQLNLVLSKSLLPNNVNCLHLLQMFMSGFMGKVNKEVNKFVDQYHIVS